MTALQLALSELRRMTSGVLPKLAIIALTIVPLLYGAVYLYANWDPQANMSNLTAALVVEDEGAVDGDGHRQELGKEVARALHDSHSFTWQDVDTMEEASRGVEKGTYSFAVRIPKDFSRNLLSTGNIRPGDEGKAVVPAMLEVVTNDANNYTINTFVDRLLTEVHASVAKQVGTETADKFLTSMGVIHTRMGKAADGADKLHDGTTKLRTGAKDLDDGSSRLSTGAKELDDGITQLKAGQQKLKKGATDLHTGTTALQKGAADLDRGATDLRTGTTQLKDGATRLHTGATQLSTGLDTLDTKTSTIVSDTEKLADGAEQVADANGLLNTRVQDAIGTIKQVPADAREHLVTTTDRLVADQVLTREQADEVLARYDQRQKSPKLVQAEKDLDDASTRMQKLADGSRQVADGNRKLATAMPQLRKGIVDAGNGADKLATGAGDLEDGATKVDAGATKLAQGTGKLKDGATKVDDGAAQLEKGLGQSVTGVTRLKEGSGKLATGAKDLHAGTTSLLKGAKDLDEGADELATGLSDGAAAVPHLTDDRKKEVSEVMGDPVAITRVSQAQAATYGAGLAPFFLSLALWVGVFMLVQAMRPITRRALASNARAWRIALGGWIPFWIVSVFQATILGAVVHWVLGLQPSSLPLTWGFMLLATLAFTAIIQGIVALLGTSGKFVVLILLVLQLVASGGTLPWQLTPQPLHVVHQLLPMSHVVEGLRRIIYGSDVGAVAAHAWALVAYTVFGLALSVLAAHKHKTWTLKTLQPEIAI